MKATIKPKVITQELGYRVKQMTDGKKHIKKYGVYADKNIMNEEKGFDTVEDAVELMRKINNREIKTFYAKEKGNKR